MNAEHGRLLRISGEALLASILISGCASAADEAPENTQTISTGAATETARQPSAAVTACPVDTPQVIPEGAMAYFLNAANPYYAEIDALEDVSEYAYLKCPIEKLKRTPVAEWVGDWSGDAEQVRLYTANIAEAAAARNEMPLFVVYNIPGRDLGQSSAGGAADAETYLNWVKEGISQGIGDNHAVVIVEPDALAQTLELRSQDPAAAEIRIATLRAVLQLLADNNVNAVVYLDAGHNAWPAPEQTAELLTEVDGGTGLVQNLSLNVSNLGLSEEIAQRARELSELNGVDYHILEDISRNGAKVDQGKWCNNLDAKLGSPEDLAYLAGAVIEQAFIKTPGHSDGTQLPECEGSQIEAGHLDPRLLESLLQPVTQ